jgi:hypothetical protein
MKIERSISIASSFDLKYVRFVPQKQRMLLGIVQQMLPDIAHILLAGFLHKTSSMFPESPGKTNTKEHNSTNRKVDGMSRMERIGALKTDRPMLMRSTDNNISCLLTTSRREANYRVNKAEFDGIREALLSRISPARLNGSFTGFHIFIYPDTPDRRHSRAVKGSR